MKSRRKD